MTCKKLNILLLAAVAIFAIFLCGCSSDYKPELKDAQIKTPNILEEGTLKVGVNADNPPMAGETSKIAGIDVDVAKSLADYLGLKAEIVDVGTSGSKALKDKKIDVLMGVDTSASLEKCNKSKPYIATAAVLFSKDMNAKIPAKDSTKKIGAQMASSGALSAQNQLNVANIKLESNLTACFDSLQNGRIDYVASDAVIGCYSAGTSDVDCYMIGRLSSISGYCVGTLDSNLLLQTKIAAALEYLNRNGDLSVIQRKWLGRDLNLDALPKTESADNTANMSAVDDAVYDKTH